MTLLRSIVYCCLFVIFSLTSCVPSKRELRPSESVPEAYEIVKGLKDANEKVESIKGLADVKATIRGKDTNVKEIIVVKRPGKIRLETVGIFGSPLLIMATDGSTFSMHMPIENRFSSGKLSSAAAPFPFNILGAGDIADIFLGNTPLIQYGYSHLEYSDKERSYVLTLESSDRLKKQVIHMEAGSLHLLKSMIMDMERNIGVSASYNGYQDVLGIPFPKEIKVDFLPDGDSIRIKYEDIEMNSEIGNDLFVLAPPAYGSD